MRPHHRAVALEPTGGENDGVGIKRGRDAFAGLNVDAAHALVRHHEPARLGFVEKFHACAFGGFQKLFNDGATAPDRLDTGRAGAEIINGNDEFDSVGLEPSNGRDRVLGKRPKIVSVGQSAGRLAHVVFKTGRKPIGRSQPHVGRTPAGISAGFIFARFFQQCNIDAQAAAARLPGRGKRRGEAGSAMSDNNQLLEISRHSGNHKSSPEIRLSRHPHRYRRSIPSQSRWS
jgi:hypothetical protein